MSNWSNWARTTTAHPRAVSAPHTIADAVETITLAARTGGTVRPLGAGHSFTTIGAPHHAYALDLRNWTGITHADPYTGLVTVRAGTHLRQLNTELDKLGLALPVLGDIDRQTLAGAISTGTHGTGPTLGGLAAYVTALELLTADGQLLTCSRNHRPDLFAAARIGLGALGILTTITLRCVPAFTLTAVEYPASFDDVLDHADRLLTGHDHPTLYWFPHADRMLVKLANRHGTDVPALSKRLRRRAEIETLENGLFGAVCALARTAPPLTRTLNRVCAALWSGSRYTDRSYRVLAGPRRVRFLESEYAIPRTEVTGVLSELRTAARSLANPVMFPIEVRVAAADDIWLSTAYQRDTAYIAVHQARGMPHREWFTTFERIAGQVAGRPHWGKIHTLDSTTLERLYPRIEDFRRVRDTVDPHRMFSNPYLDRVLGHTIHDAV